MKLGDILKTLENGEEVVLLYSNSFINALQVAINQRYQKFDIDVQKTNNQVKLKLLGDYIKL